MGITPKFTRADIEKRLKAFLSEVELLQIEALQELGEMCIEHARNIPANQGFQDQTGNLRSSIGYMVFKNGVAVHTAYDKVMAGSDGAMKGEALAKKVGEGKQGISLVVTAGMNYAVYVEATGRDVLTSAEKLAERVLPKMLEELVSNINEATG